MLVVKELDDWHPRVAIVHVVAEARGVDDRETNCAAMSTKGEQIPIWRGSALRTFKKFLLKLRLCDLALHGLVNWLGMTAFVIGVVLNRSGKKGVDECGRP